MNVLNNLVEEMILKHKGGEVFFDNLDISLRNKDFISMLWDTAKKENYLYNIPTSSGTFGIYFSNYMNSLGIENFTVNGSLRKGKKIISLEPFKDRIKNRKFIFFDDSFYLGRTRDSIKAELEQWGGQLIATYVCYDGSCFLDKSVHSLYRYYNLGESNG